jgi:hypothetical protein
MDENNNWKGVVLWGFTQSYLIQYEEYFSNRRVDFYALWV